MGREVKNNQGSDWTGHRVGRKREEETATQSDTRHTCETRPGLLLQDLILDKDGDHPESEQQYTGEGLYAVRPSPRLPRERAQPCAMRTPTPTAHV